MSENGRGFRRRVVNKRSVKKLRNGKGSMYQVFVLKLI